MIDSHCHLEMKDFDADRPTVFEKMEEFGITHAISIGSLAENERLEKTIQIINEHNNVFTTLGVHPKSNYKSLNDLKNLFEINFLNLKEKVVAIGEIGLDYFEDGEKVIDKKKQEELFRFQIELAFANKLPIAVHIRDAYDEAYEILKSYHNSNYLFYGGVIHCFSGKNTEDANKFLDIGYFISIAGKITYRKNQHLRDIIKGIPDEKILIETDSPFLAPQKYRGKRNEPSYVRFIAETIADEKNIDIEKFKELTVQNTVNLFSLNGVEGFYPAVAYKIRDSVYVNLTNKCTNKCIFCPKYQYGAVNFNVKGYNLELKKEPSETEVLSSIFHYYNFKEVVFCGLGEPTLRLDVLKKAALYLKKKGIYVRLDTDGLANAVYGRNIAKELGEYIDCISISLNASDSDYYNAICRPQIKRDKGLIIEPFKSILEFIDESKKYINKVIVSAVGLKDLDIEKVKKIAEEKGVKFKLRKYNDVG
ncbi:MAG: YchF/TatD family DNA exonuclease [Deltaproteobacteria bacterium]|nr:YchF/TatD family DNA exonuclease [Deltaproteobacteria bacterium]